jgi:hypothetical protein
MAKALSVNAKALKGVKVNEAAIAWFKPYLDKWPETAGPLPTPEMLMAAAQFSTRGAGRESGFHALQLREAGCSIFQLGQAFNCGPAHNHTRDLVKAGYFERSKVGAADSDRASAFILTFTEKGVADLQRRLGVGAPKAKPAKPVKVARKRNKAPLPAAAETPTSDAPAATEATTSLPATVEAIAALADHFNA